MQNLASIKKPEEYVDLNARYLNASMNKYLANFNELVNAGLATFAEYNQLINDGVKIFTANTQKTKK